MNDDLKKEYVKGAFQTVSAVIAAIALIVAAVLQNKNSELITKVQELNSQIESLQNENADLKEEYKSVEELTQKVSELTEENNRLRETNKNNTDSSPPDENEAEEAKKKSGEQSEAQEGVDLLSVCEAYESYDYETPEIITIMGIEYENGFTIRNGFGASYASFNIQGNYSRLEFDVAPIDGSIKEGDTLGIYLDNVAQESITLVSDMILTHFEYDIAGISQLKFELEGWFTSGHFGFVNVKVR